MLSWVVKRTIVYDARHVQFRRAVGTQDIDEIDLVDREGRAIRRRDKGVSTVLLEKSNVEEDVPCSIYG